MNKQTTVVQTFSYNQLDAETSALCHKTAQLAETFMQFARRTIDKGMELGEHLVQIKEKLPHGQYKPYVASIGVPYPVAYYWTHKVKEQRQLEIVDIYYLPEDEKLDIKLLPEPYKYATNSTEAMNAYNENSFIDALEESLDRVRLTHTGKNDIILDEHQPEKPSPAQQWQEQPTLPQQPQKQTPHTYGDNSKTSEQSYQEMQERINKWMNYARRRGVPVVIPASKEGLLVGHPTVGGYATIPYELLEAHINTLLVRLDEWKRGL